MKRKNCNILSVYNSIKVNINTRVLKQEIIFQFIILIVRVVEALQLVLQILRHPSRKTYYGKTSQIFAIKQYEKP